MSVGTRIEKAAAILGVGPGASAELLADLAWLAGILSEDLISLEQEKIETKQGEQRGAGQKAAEVLDSDSGGSSKKKTSSRQKRRSKGKDSVEVFPKAAPPSSDFVPATLVSIPATDPLPARLAIERALKPFLKKVSVAHPT